MSVFVRFVLACALVTVAGPGCARRDPEAAAWVRDALSANRQADLLVQRGDAAGARDLLRASAEKRTPEGAAPGDARIVRQDLYYRIADLELSSGNVEAARRAASKGIELGRGQDVFTANLLIVRGHALEAGRDLSAASRDYHDALVITDVLLGEHLRTEQKAP